ncbi:hypothetical protein EDB89DRAFT_1967970 [Lactarius sanguifluus]|nr:hypothetical protein EDB89DRAFT_1967970 [Lactarius sanguifluus]
MADVVWRQSFEWSGFMQLSTRGWLRLGFVFFLLPTLVFSLSLYTLIHSSSSSIFGCCAQIVEPRPPVHRTRVLSGIVQLLLPFDAPFVVL